MARLLYKIRRFTLISLAGLLILIVLSQGLLRLMLPMAHDQRHRLEGELSELLQASVTIGRIDSHWQYFVPYLDLLDIQVHSEQGDTQTLKRLSIGADIVDMLRAGSIAPSTLQVEGLNLILLEKDGRWSLPGIVLPEKEDSEAILDWQSIIAHKHVELKSSSIELRHADKDMGQSMVFDNVDVSFLTSDDTYTGHARWSPPTELGRPAAIAFDLRGELGIWDGWRGDLHIDVPRMDLTTLNTFFPPAMRLHKGHLGAALNISIAETGIKSSRGLIDAWFEFDKNKSVRWQGPVFVDAQPGQVKLKVAEPLQAQGFGDAEELNEILQGLNVDLNMADQLSVGLGIAELDVSHGLRVLGAYLKKDSVWHQRLSAMQPQGRLKRLFSGWDSRDGWYASARLEDLQTQAVDRIPGVSKLNADILFKQGSWLAELDEQSVTLDTNGVFIKPLVISRLHGQFEAFEDQGDWVLRAPSLFLDTPDIKTHSDVQLRFAAGKQPYLTLHATAEDGIVANIPQYIPRVLKPGTLKWLDQAFLGGRLISADAHLEGYVNELVHENSSALFRIDADIENAQFSYAKHWPQVSQLDGHFNMLGARIEVSTKSAEVSGLRPRYVKAVVPNIRRASLELYVDAPRSSVEHLLSYVNGSPISQIISDSGKLFQGEGYADVVLNLKKNISKKHFADLSPHFNGKISLQQAALYMPLLDMPLEKLEGSIDFSHQHVNADRLQGNIFARPFSATAVTNKTQDELPRVSFDLNAQLALQDMLKDRVPLLTNAIKGRAWWNAHLELPLSKGQKSASLSLKSSLQGTAIDLPPPLQKDSTTATDFAAYVVLNNQAANRLWLDYQQELQGVLVFSRQDKGLYGGQLNYLRGKPVLPRERGLVVNAAVAEVDIGPWLDWGINEGGDVATDSVLRRIDLEGDRVSYRGGSVDQAKLSLSKVEQGWSATIDSAAVRGKLNIPRGQQAMQLALETLDMGRVQFRSEGQSENIDPRSLPPVDAEIGRFLWDEVDIANIKLSTQTIESGLRIPALTIDDPYLSLQGEGAWQINDQEHQQTTLEFDVQTEDMQQALKKIKVNNLIRGGRGEFQARLQWGKPPHQFDLASLNGQVSGSIKKGDLLTVKPGIAKAIGLFNLDSLPKRLILDFKDISSKGLAFDKAKMEIGIEQGIASFDHMVIDTDLGTISVDGRADLVREELDQIAKINPDVSNLLPITAGVVGGVPGLVGALLVDQVLKAFGRDADRVAQIRYKISGTWSDPSVESTRVKRVRDLTDEELKARAEELVIKAQGVDYGQQVIPGELELDVADEEALFDED